MCKKYASVNKEYYKILLKDIKVLKKEDISFIWSKIKSLLCIKPPNSRCLKDLNRINKIVYVLE